MWSEFYDPEEREDIIRWGIDPVWLERELEIHHHGSDHAIYPLLETDPFPERMRIYISARFETPAGGKLWGYVINEDAYGIGVFLCGEEFVFNPHPLLERDNEEQRARLGGLMGDPSDPVFPLRYWTGFTDSKGKPIEGVFRLDTGAA